jgi:hypothetical protein
MLDSQYSRAGRRLELGTAQLPHAFTPWLAQFEDQGIIFTDWGFRCGAGVPDNVKLCKKGTHNDRMLVETAFSLLTVVADAKHLYHRQAAYIEAHLAYPVAMFNICLRLFHRLHPQEPAYKMSLAEFSL